MIKYRNKSFLIRQAAFTFTQHMYESFEDRSNLHVKAVSKCLMFYCLCIKCTEKVPSASN